MPLALDILNEIADRLGWPQVDSIEPANLPTETRKLLRLMNRVLTTLGGLDDWPMLRAQSEIVLVADVTADVTTGTEQYLTATQNSTTVTIANMTSVNAAYVGAAFQASGYDYVYRIESINNSGSFELNRAWIDASITAADETVWTIAWDRYALPENFDRPIDDFNSFLAPYGLDPISPEELAERRRRRSGDIHVGEIEKYTIFGMNAAQTQEILHVDPWPDASRLITYDYIMVHPTIDSDNDKILFPRRVVEVIIDAIIQLAYRDYEDDDRMQTVLIEMLQKYNQAVGKKTVTQHKRVMRPDGRVRREIYRAYRAGGGNVDWGDTFDRAGNVGFF